MDDEVSRRHLLTVLGGATAGLAGCSFGTSAGTDGTDGAGSTQTSDRAESSPTAADAPDTQTPPDIDVETPAETPQGPAKSEFTEVYRDVIDSVPAISVEVGVSSGSGTAWMYDEVHAVTNEHIVGDASSAAVRFRNDGWRDATIIGSDVYSDLGVVRVSNPPADAKPLQLVDRPQPVGTRVMAIGNPFGLSGSATSGIVSGIDRSLPGPDGTFSIPDAIQTDAAANPGNSGGPLMTLDGRVAGVINSGISSGDNIGFAISAALTERVVPALIERGEYEHSFMGISYRDVGPTLARANNLPVTWGIYVDDTLDGSPADGVLEGTTDSAFTDGQSVPIGGDVIVNIDGTVIQTQQDLGTFLALETSPGETIDVTVIRDGRKVTVPLTLGTRPPPS